jgi:hypothetical protein
MLLSMDAQLNPPIKRHVGLQDLSRDHHDGLLLCWKIREGFRKKIELKRIWEYVLHVYQKALQPHFQIEENHIFPLLPADHPLLIQAQLDHDELRRLFNTKNDPQTALPKIEKKLSAHIRFEEREMFQELQKLVPEKQLIEISRRHNGKHKDNWNDSFWL